MIPLMLDLSDSRLLVFGAGSVGIRKLHSFLGNCKEITIIAKECRECIAGASCLELDLASLSDEDLASLIARHDFIIAATNDAALNKKIVSAARTQGKWFNSSDEPGTFLLPAVFRDDGVTLAVSTEGKAPAVAAFVRDSIRDRYPGLSIMTGVQAFLRASLKESEPSQARRADLLRRILADDEIWQAANTGDAEKALALARSRI